MILRLLEIILIIWNIKFLEYYVKMIDYKFIFNENFEK